MNAWKVEPIEDGGYKIFDGPNVVGEYATTQQASAHHVMALQRVRELEGVIALKDDNLMLRSELGRLQQIAQARAEKEAAEKEAAPVETNGSPKQ